MTQTAFAFANGIASHDTFSRVFSLLDAQRFETCFVGWTKAMCPNLAQQFISMDGKSVRRSHNGQSCMAHFLVSAWHIERGLVLAQVKTAAKSNKMQRNHRNGSFMQSPRPQRDAARDSVNRLTTLIREPG